MKPVLTPRELAEAIGVSESSLKRWANDGLIDVSRTEGGHRRIQITEAIRFIRTIRAPLARPEMLGLDEIRPGQWLLEDPHEELTAALLNGFAREARGLILSLYLSGRSVGEIADGAVRLAMKRVGDIWRDDPRDAYIEHRATDIVVAAIQRLRLLVEPTAPVFVAVGGAVPGDPYILPSLLATTALAAEGIDTVNLGPNTPFEAMQQAATDLAPRLVWISASVVTPKPEIETALVSLAEALSETDLVMIGGRALPELDLGGQSVLQPGATIQDLVAAATALK